MTGRRSIVTYARSCFWLLAPVLLLNVLATGALPPAYQPDVFWRDIPLPLAMVENAARVLVIALPALVPLELRSRAQRVGAVVFAGGIAGYGLAWFALIAAPHSAWSTSALGFSAPAWSPALWIAGLVLLSERTWFTRFRHVRLVLGTSGAIFLAAHVSHALLVFERSV